MNIDENDVEDDSDQEDMEEMFNAYHNGHWNDLMDINNMAQLFNGIVEMPVLDDDEDDDLFYDDYDDDFDEDLMDSDFDFDSDEEELAATAEKRKYFSAIFKTLEDSSVLARLCFHRESSKPLSSRLPRIVAGQTETYETLHKLLEEVELLLKVWKKRVQHPFTAHLEHMSKSKDDPEGLLQQQNSHDQMALVWGTDYHESDVESDATDRSNFNNSKAFSKSSVTLTRKKYCQSAKMYYNIFNSEVEFESLQGQVKSMRKLVFNVAFNLFLANLPSERLPNELWEKIWKMTMEPNQPNMPPTHSSGVREKSSRKWTLFENERITDCFGAVGNLHMILFEILYKHSLIMTIPQFLEMETRGNLAKFKYFRHFFFKVIKRLSMKFARLDAFDHALIKEEPTEEHPPSLNLLKKAEKGQFLLSGHKVTVEDKAISDSRVLFFIWSKDPCGLAALIHTSEENAVVTIWDVNEDKELFTFNTRITLFDFFLHPESLNEKNRKFSLTNDQFSMLLCEEKSVKDGVIFYKWSWDRTQKDCIPVAKSLIIDPQLKEDHPPDMQAEMTLLTLLKDFHLVEIKHYSAWDNDNAYCNFFVIREDDSGQPRLEKVAFSTLPKGSHKIQDTKGSMVLMEPFFPSTDLENKDTIWLYDLQAENVVEKYKTSEICDMTGNQSCSTDGKAAGKMHQHCEYVAKFDLFRDQFVIVKEFFSGFVIYDFDPSDLNRKPQISKMGAMFTPLSSYSRFLFVNGIILCTDPIESKLIPTSPEALFDFRAMNIEVVMIDLEAKLSQTLVTFGKCTRYNSNFLLNEAHRTIACKSEECMIWPVLNPLSANAVTLMVDKSSYVTIDFSLSPQQIAETEAEAMHQKQIEKEKVLKKAELEKKIKRAKQESNKIKQESVAAKYVNNPEMTVEGSIHSWKGTYGFMNPKGEAKPLGSLFVHISRMANAPNDRKVIRNGQWIECKVSKDENHDKFMAVDIVLKSRPVEEPNSQQQQPEGAAVEKPIVLPGARGRGRGGRGRGFRGRGRRGIYRGAPPT